MSDLICGQATSYPCPNRREDFMCGQDLQEHLMCTHVPAWEHCLVGCGSRRTHVNVSDGNLAEGLDGCAKEPLKNLVGNPLTVCGCIPGPNLSAEGGDQGEKVYWSLAVLKGQWLPDEATPAEEQEPFARQKGQGLKEGSVAYM